MAEDLNVMTLTFTWAHKYISDINKNMHLLSLIQETQLECCAFVSWIRTIVSFSFHFFFKYYFVSKEMKKKHPENPEITELISSSWGL